MKKKKTTSANEGKASAKAASEFEHAAAAAGLPAKTGKAAMGGQYRDGISATANIRFTASIDMDAAYRKHEGSADRWDYGLGLKHGSGNELAVWIEPHPASSTGEVAKILAKLDWLESKLASPQFRELDRLTREAARAGLQRFHWLAMTGSVRIRPGSKEANELIRRGLQLPGRHIQLKPAFPE